MLKAFSMDVDQIAGPFEGENGVYIIKLVDREEIDDNEIAKDEEEINRLHVLILKYLNSQSKEFMNAAIIENDENNDNDEDHRPIGAGLAKNFVSFVTSIANNSTDEGLVYICRYWMIMNKFKMH